MKIAYNKKISTIVLVCFGVISLIIVNGCVESKAIAEKSGMKLWSENCSRCHNAPPSSAFSNEEWKTIGMHMQSRAILTKMETDKIITFLQN